MMCRRVVEHFPNGKISLVVMITITMVGCCATSMPRGRKVEILILNDQNFKGL